MTDQLRLQQVIRQIDQANQADPNREHFEGGELPKEQAYSRHMADWLEKLQPNAPDEVQIAAYGQHICRWMMPRSDYPLDRAGYHRWRSNLQKFHATKLAGILEPLGYSAESITRVQSLVKKVRFKQDPEAQLVEDVACLVFLQYYLEDFAAQHDDDKVIAILQKTWPKMSETAQQAALTIPLSVRLQALVQRALHDTTSAE
ncbi:MAG: DUF4202 domain-containing protein [Planctomycetota bacterium]|nr:DUF4202 domain-containing protein [Planctomycetota bacterium]